MKTGEIYGIFISTARNTPMISLEASEIVEDFGLRGDRKAQVGSKRQVLLVDDTTLERAGVPAGGLNENLAVRGLDINALQAGQHVRIGDVLLEITGPCTVCGELEHIRSGLKEELRGRRGMLARVLRGGTVGLGDQLVVETHEYQHV
jgi:MOSC domain-containing protein YiiM